MALVTSLEQNQKVRHSVHRPTRCLYAIVDGSAGERYLQLDTVGSADREIPDKVSQSIQFDRQAAGQLLGLLLKAFPDLASSIDEISDTEEPSSDDSEEEGFEGRTQLILHRSKERNPRLIRRKKRRILTETGKLLCEVCGFDFTLVYGHLGSGFAECHHRVPIATLNGETPTRLSDLAIVCANCHRMLHRPPGHTIEQLRAIVRECRNKIS
ncbi:HNH endonuclease [Tautonia marina]|uniref:HNH endonuclease n=1 Tax=Tautonia marina TaxID=2653855 RepID=UPI001260EF95|nr:HNH endonuclease [Tautonia marina]